MTQFNRDRYSLHVFVFFPPDIVYFQVRQEVGDVTILINNAGIVTGRKFMDSSDHLVEKTLQVNTMAHFWVFTVFPKVVLLD